MSDVLRNAAVSFTLIAFPCHAAGTHFGFKQIVVSGSSNVSAFALNNKSEFAGVYTDAAGAHAFIMAGSKLTVLPAPPDCRRVVVPIPTAINAYGKVVGAVRCFDEHHGFRWNGRSYAHIEGMRLGRYATIIGINNAGEEFYEHYIPTDPQALIGYPGKFNDIGLPGSFSFVSSLNNYGVAAGSDGVGNGEVFTYDKGVRTNFLPPGAYSSNGGFVNDNGEVAGMYERVQGGSYSGFVYSDGQYTTFDVPGIPLGIVAFNNNGRAVGLYKDTTRNVLRLFLFNGTTVSTFGSFPPGDLINIGLNDEGAILVSDTNDGHLPATSVTWRVLCNGPGC